MNIQNTRPIGDNIRKWRNLRGFKQQDFATLIGVSKSTLSKIENGTHEVKITLLQNIATCLKVKPAQLFTDPNDLLPPPPAMINNNN